jgi:flagellar basal body-associated protein FliL
MLKILGIFVVAVVSLLIGSGGTFGVMTFLHHGASAAGSAGAPQPRLVAAVIKPTYFASLSDITVSIPPEPETPATSYVLFSIKFSTTDQGALVAFDELQPIIKSAIITRLLNETTQSLQSLQARTELMASALGIVNGILAKSLNYNPPNPFTAAYIANLVTQD